jgi:hypothetical protein
VPDRKPNIARKAAPAPAEANDDDAEMDGPTADADAEGSDDDEQIDVDGFQDQPLTRADAANVGKLAKDWGQLLEKFGEAQEDMMPKIASALAEVGEPAAQVCCRICARPSIDDGTPTRSLLKQWTR